MRIESPSPIPSLSLVTGASAGIGEAFARQLAARGHNLVLTARRVDRLDHLAEALRKQHRIEVTVLPADLADPAAAGQLCETLGQRGLHVDWLINNAGYGVPGSFAANGWAAHADFLRVLVAAPTELAWRLLPDMHRRGRGRIINVASLAGFMPGTAGHTLYAAAKAYLISFSQSLALENRARGVHVCALCPGFTRSEFHDITGTRGKMDKLPAFMWLDADEVARQGIAAVERGDVVHVTGRVNRMIKALAQCMPDRWMLWLSSRESRRFRDHDGD